MQTFARISPKLLFLNCMQRGRFFDARPNDSGRVVPCKGGYPILRNVELWIWLFVVCVFFTSACWSHLTSHESTRFIKQAHFGRTFPGHLQSRETMAREEVAAARLVVAVTLLLSRCSHPSPAVTRCKAFWSACRQIVTSVTRFGASGVLT